MKKCSTCRKRKEATDFYGNRSQRDGVDIYCKSCRLAHNAKAKQRRVEAGIEQARARAVSKRYYDRNVQQERARQRGRHASDPAKAKERMRRWRAADPKRAREADRRWKLANPIKIREGKSRRRYATQLSPKWDSAARIEVVYAKAAALGLEVDHVVPLQSSIVTGLHVWHNLQLLDKLANASKNNRHWPDMP